MTARLSPDDESRSHDRFDNEWSRLLREAGDRTKPKFDPMLHRSIMQALNKLNRDSTPVQPRAHAVRHVQRATRVLLSLVTTAAMVAMVWLAFDPGRPDFSSPVRVVKLPPDAGKAQVSPAMTDPNRSAAPAAVGDADGPVVAFEPGHHWLGAGIAWIMRTADRVPRARANIDFDGAHPVEFIAAGDPVAHGDQVALSRRLVVHMSPSALEEFANGILGLRRVDGP